MTQHFAPDSTSDLSAALAFRDQYAMVIDRFGTAEEFRKVDISPADSVSPAPTALLEPGEVAVRTSAIGANPLDYKMRDGSSGLCKNIQFPCTLGREFAGVVTAVGSDVSGFRVGDRVFGMRSHDDLRGTYATDIVVPAAIVTPSPAGVGDTMLAALSVVGLTAVECVDKLGKVQSGDVVLIHGAGGGVGQLMTQLAVRRGARVLAVASSKHEHKLAKWGAEHIDYTAGDVFARVRELAPEGVDVVLDGVYFDTFIPSLDVVKPDGRVIELPSLADLTPAVQRNIEAATPVISPRPEVLQALAQDIADGAIDVHIGGIFPLDQVSKVHEELEAGHANGKLVLIP